MKHELPKLSQPSWTYMQIEEAGHTPASRSRLIAALSTLLSAISQPLFRHRRAQRFQANAAEQEGR